MKKEVEVEFKERHADVTQAIAKLEKQIALNSMNMAKCKDPKQKQLYQDFVDQDVKSLDILKKARLEGNLSGNPEVARIVQGKMAPEQASEGTQHVAPKTVRPVIQAFVKIRDLIQDGIKKHKTETAAKSPEHKEQAELSLEEKVTRAYEGAKNYLDSNPAIFKINPALKQKVENDVAVLSAYHFKATGAYEASKADIKEIENKINDFKDYAKFADSSSSTQLKK